MLKTRIVKLEKEISEIKTLLKENTNIKTIKTTNSKNNIKSNEMGEILKNYWNSSNWKQRINYVYNPDQIKNLMEKHYKLITVEKPDSINIVNSSKKEIADGIYSIEVVTEYDGYKNSSVYYLRKTNEKYKIDWKASIGYNNMTWKSFIAKDTKSSKEFRVNASLDDYYNFYFRDKEDEYYSVKFEQTAWDFNNNDQYLSYNGYIEKESDKGEQLYKLLEDGQKHRIIVKVTPEEGKEVFKIENFRKSWVGRLDNIEMKNVQKNGDAEKGSLFNEENTNIVDYSKILINPDKYLNEKISMIGEFYFKNIERESFDINNGDYEIEVFYENLSNKQKEMILSTKNFSDKKVFVEGRLHRYSNRENTYYMDAFNVKIQQ